jgi:histone-lysine N-methyltransferase SETMAR
MNKKIRPVIHFLFLSKLSNKEIHCKINEIYGEKTIGLSTVKKWTKRFKEGNEIFDDEKKIGRRKKRKKTMIMKLIEEKPNISLREIGLSTNIHKDTAKRIIRDEIGFIRTNSKWIPYELTDDQKTKRMELSEKLLEILIRVPEKEKRNIITMDETWLYWKNPVTSLWQLPGNERPKKIKLNIGSKKLLLTVVWSFRGIELVNFLPRKQKFDKEYFSTIVLEEFSEVIQKRRPKKGTKGLMLHLDNARPHLINEEFEKRGIIRLPHPPYSPDLAPSDFFLFGYLKKALEGFNFVNDNDLMEETKKILFGIEKEILRNVFDEWVKRLKLCLINKGDYF